MTEENTDTFIKKSTNNQSALDSQFGGISIRAWLALMVIGTICAIQIAFATRAMIVKDYNYTVDGQFWMIVSSVIVYYYADKKQANNTTETPKT